MNKDIEYIRIATNYYKIINKPLISGDTTPIMTKWNKDTIIADHGRKYLNDIPKLDGFCCIPSHESYQQEINGFYNTYNELPLKPKHGKIKHSLNFVEHIFGNQKEFGLDYIQLLYDKPTLNLPILCLVSKERATGKSTFIKWLKAMFGANMTYIKGDNFSSQFNADWASKLIIAVDEVFFDKREITERLKYLSTTDKDKIEKKGHDREEIEFFGKFILCSNNEDNFILIDQNEIRFWVRKIPPFEVEDTLFLKKLIEEIPAFLHFISNRELSTEQKSRMWFSPEQIETKALKRLMWLNNNKLEMDLLSLVYEIFEAIKGDEFHFCVKELTTMMRQLRNYRLNNQIEIRRIVKNKWKLTPQDNSLTYKGVEWTSYGEFHEIDRVGRFYTVERNFIQQIFDELMNE